MLKKIILFPWHVLFFGAYPILFFFSKNTLDFPHTVIYLPLLISLALIIVFIGLFYLMFKSIDKAAFLTSFILITLYTSGFIGMLFYGRFRKEHALIIAISLFIGGIIALYKIKKPFIPMTKLLNFMALILISAPLYSLTMHNLQMRELRQGPSFNTDFSNLKLSNSYNNPNIYYIILDAYSRQDILKKYYNYDNEWFLKELEQRGFYIANKSCSNYPGTIYSIPSSINGNYLQPMINNISMSTDTYDIYAHFLCNNFVFTWLKNLGYHVHNIDSSWVTNSIIPVDELIDPLQRQRQNEHAFKLHYSEGFNKALLHHTVLHPMLNFLPKEDPIAWNPWKNFFGLDHFKTFDKMAMFVNGQIDCLGKQTWRFAMNPHCVFCHILCPHGPFFFNKDGTCACENKYECSPAEMSQYIVQGYADQVHALSHKILEAIDSILENSSKRPIIIIQGDHGARNHPEDHPLLANYPILNAYLVPDEMRNLLYESISPVNSFRIIFNHLFGANLALLPDRCYLLDSNNKSIFHDVTDEYMKEIAKL